MDKYVVRLLSRAYRDLDGIYAYIAETLLETSTAQKLLDVLEKAIFSLEELPKRGAPRKNGAYANKGYRQLFTKNFTLIYRVDETKKQVVIVTVRYSKSQF
ncbi:MAG: type II toxin-antitoxin system RelE/ParE family toxin [Firmicutes bacterium HGW-Firmicutes-15]|nr:MAG: type II toxin-antitoxin system RelE/ParE family toxin [Firmicutes bacterium HGW-Firmicutes-15]